MLTSTQSQISELLRGRLPANSIDAETWRKMVRWSNNDLDRQISKIAQLRADGKHRQARSKAMATTRRMGARFAAAVEAVHKKALPKCRDQTADSRQQRQLRLVSTVCEGFQDIGRFNRPALAFLEPKVKKDGTFRTTIRFDWRDYARQYLLDKIYTPFAEFHPAQYQRKKVPGLGGTAAIREALSTALTMANRNDVFVHFDIVRCYDHIPVGWLERNLWLPKDIIRGHVHTIGMRLVRNGNQNVRDDLDEAVWKNGRLGLPQGSALSPLISDIVIASILRAAAVSKKYPLFVWSDNIGVIVPREDVAALKEDFRAAFAQHEAGPFELTVSVHPIDREFKFLGYWFRRTKEGVDVFCPTTIADAWLGSVYERLSVADAFEEIRHIESHVQGKLGQWKWWPGVSEYKEEALQLIADHKDLLEARLQ